MYGKQWATLDLDLLQDIQALAGFIIHIFPYYKACDVWFKEVSHANIYYQHKQLLFLQVFLIK